ncbi:MAG: YgjV family protein [Methylobacteriaceae bacterium]|jgi:hypothetical protein|nr:YgjV family protein [Methylobacteriaceae bacterium]
MVWSFPQILGYIAFVVGVVAFSQKIDVRLKAVAALQGLILSVHFFLLDDFTAAFLMGVNVLRNISSIFTHSVWVALIFVTIIIGGGYVTAEHWNSYMITAAQVASTLGLFLLSAVGLRAVFAVSSALWIINNFLTGSIGGVAIETSLFIANLVTMIRLQRERKAAS